MAKRIKNVKPFDTIVLPEESHTRDGWTAREWYVVAIHEHNVEALALDEEGKLTDHIRCFSYGDLYIMGLEK